MALTPEQEALDYNPELQGLSRERKLAELLMAKGLQQPQGQMISGYYVAPSFAQQLNPMANVLAGQAVGERADTKQLQLAQALKEQQVAEVENIMGADNPQDRLKLAVRGNSPMSKTLASKLLENQYKGPSWAEVSQFNPKTGNTDTYVYDKNSSDPKSTMRFVATSKPAFTPSEELHLNDQGIGTGRYGNANVVNQGGPAVGGMPNAPMSGNMPMGGNMPVASGNVAMAGGAPTVKPVAATNAPADALVTTYGYDPFKPPPMPAMPSGSAARSWKADIYKPLEGTPANTVTGATTYVDALGKYNDYVSGLDAKDLANPQVRNRLNSLYAQVKLTGKEANNLGVLNGGDEKILEEVVPNYSNIMITKGTVKKILDEQKEFGSSKIVATYRTAQKPVPENMRKYVVVPKIEEAPTGSPKQTGATARAVLNGQIIEVRNGKWVNSKTGEEVK
jgi:hypothetical protein